MSDDKTEGVEMPADEVIGEVGPGEASLYRPGEPEDEDVVQDTGEDVDP